MKIVQIKLKNNDWQDISHLVAEGSICKTTTLCGSSNKSTIDDCSFELQYLRDPSLKILFENQFDIECQIFNEDRTPFFKGIIKDGISQTLDSGADKINLTVLDNSYKLDNECNEFAIERALICDPTDTGNSIVHRVLSLAGYTPNEIAIDSLIGTTLRVVAAEDEEFTWREILDNLLTEYGFVLVFNAEGKASLKQWEVEVIPETIPLLDEKNILSGGLSRTKKEREFSGVRVFWSDIKDTADKGNTGREPLYIGSVGYQVTPDGTEHGTDILSGGVWPENAEYSADPIFQNFNYEPLNYSDQSSDKSLFYIRKENKNLSLIYSYDHKLSLRDSVGESQETPGPGLSILKSNFYQKKAEIVLKNNSPSMISLYRVDVLAHAVFRYSKNTTSVLFSDPLTGQPLFENENKNYEFTTKYVYDKHSAESLAKLLCKQKQFGAYEFNFESLEKLNVGQIITLQQANEFLAPAIIEEVEEVDDNPRIQYKARAVGKYLSVQTHTNSSRPGQTTEEKFNRIDSALNEVNKKIDESVGFNPADAWGENQTKITSNLVPIIEATPTFHANILSVVGVKDRNNPSRKIELGNLVNLAAFDWQCSKDGSTWYELGNWVTTPAVGRTTTTTSSSWSHWYAFGGTPPDNPKPFPLKYRCQFRTVSGDLSGYSDVVSATPSLVENGDFAVNSITGNKIKAESITADKLVTGFLETAFLSTEKIVIGASLSSGATIKNPSYGDRKTEIDKEGIYFYEADNNGWRSEPYLRLKKNGNEGMRIYSNAQNNSVFSSVASSFNVEGNRFELGLVGTFSMGYLIGIGFLSGKMAKKYYGIDTFNGSFRYVDGSPDPENKDAPEKTIFQVSPKGATAIGGNCQANGDYSLAQGGNCTTTGSNSFAGGSSSSASGQSGFAYGNTCVAAGSWSSAAFGYHCEARGDGSLAAGVRCTATGYASAAIGCDLKATKNYSLAVGKFNSPNDGDIFQVGWGSDDAHRTNIFSVLDGLVWTINRVVGNNFCVDGNPYNYGSGSIGRVQGGGGANRADFRSYANGQKTFVRTGFGGW